MAWRYGLVLGIVLIPATLHVYSQFAVSISFMDFASCPAYIAVAGLTAITLGRMRNHNKVLSEKEIALEEANKNLQTVLTQVRELGGIYTLCSSCKKIQDDNRQWMPIDSFLIEKTKIEFSHGICPDCAAKVAPRPPR